MLTLDVLTSSMCRARSAERRRPNVGLRCTKAGSVPRSERRAQAERDQPSVGWRFADNSRGPWLHEACLRASARVWAALRWRGPTRRAAVAVQRQAQHRIAAAAALRRESRRRGGAPHRRDVLSTAGNFDRKFVQEAA